MKRKDFLRKMRERRRGDKELERREPERRRAVDWRTLRVELPDAETDGTESQELPVGVLRLLTDGIQLEASDPCWVRGYRAFEEDGGLRAEFQYRPVDPDADPPPGATALRSGEVWTP